MQLKQYIWTKQPTTAIFDLDGTLLSTQGALTEAAATALHQLRAQGIGVLIASGRPWAKIQPFWSELKPTYPVICSNGRVIYDPEKNHVLYLDTVDPTLAIQIQQLADGVAYLLTETPTSLWCPDAKAAFMARKAMNWPRSSIQIGRPDLKETLMVCLYLVSFNADPLTASLASDISQCVGANGDVRQDNVRWLSICKPASKSNAVNWLGQYTPLSLERAIAFGDGENDLDLFERVGFAVAPANALTSVKQSAHRVTQQENERGVLEVVVEWLDLLGTNEWLGD